MRDKVDRKAVADLLIAKVFRAKDKTIRDRLVAKLCETGIVPDETTLKINQEYLYKTTEENLCRIVLALESLLDEANPDDPVRRELLGLNIHAINYFTQDEIKACAKQNEIVLRTDDIRTIHNCAKLTDDQYCGVVSVAQVARMHSCNIIRVDPDLQRDMEYRKSRPGGNEIVIREIHVNHRRVDEIAEKIKKGEYFYNAIRFNIKGCDAPEIDRDGSFTIPEDADVCVIDGNHRTLGAEQAYYDCPDLSRQFESIYFVVLITFCENEDAKRCISQEWNVERVTKRRKATMDVNWANRIVKSIRTSEDGDPAYRERMYTDSGTGRIKNGCIDEGILSEAISTAFDLDSIQTNADAKPIVNQIVSVFNEIADIWNEDLKDPKSAMQRRWNISPDRKSVV